MTDVLAWIDANAAYPLAFKIWILFVIGTVLVPALLHRIGILPR